MLKEKRERRERVEYNGIDGSDTKPGRVREKSREANRQKDTECARDPYGITILILSAFIMQTLTSKPAPCRQQ